MKREMSVILGVSAPQKRSAPPSMPKRETYGARDEGAVQHEMAETPAAERAEHRTTYVTPEAVCFRDEAETCGNCAHFGADGHCEVLEMTVAPGAGCNAFSGREGDAPNEEPAEVAA